MIRQAARIGQLKNTSNSQPKDSSILGTAVSSFRMTQPYKCFFCNFCKFKNWNKPVSNQSSLALQANLSRGTLSLMFFFSLKVIHRIQRSAMTECCFRSVGWWVLYHILCTKHRAAPCPNPSQKGNCISVVLKLSYMVS